MTKKERIQATIRTTDVEAAYSSMSELSGYFYIYTKVNIIRRNPRRLNDVLSMYEDLSRIMGFVWKKYFIDVKSFTLFRINEPAAVRSIIFRNEIK